MANDPSLIDLPPYLYKFVTWGKKYHKDILNKNTIFFSSANKFNDPFDSTVPLRYDQGTKDQIIDLYRRHIQMDNPNLNPKQIDKLAIDTYDKNNISDPQLIKYNIEFQREWARTKYGLFVLTSEFQNILMWSHYADAHRGICIRFNMDKFRKFIEHDCIKNNLVIPWYKVSYEANYPLLNPFEFNTEDEVTKILTIKSNYWEYENEFRFILFDKPNTEIKLPAGIIDLVICGCKMNINNKNKIIKIAKERSISIMQAKIKEFEFGLDFEKII
jgi:hypothetical protein